MSATTRTEQKQETARAVLAAARAEFERVGFDAANLRAIAARAGVSAGTVLHHYGDKRELLHAALFDDLEATLERAIAEAPRGPQATLTAQLAHLTRAIFGYYRDRPALSATLLKESLFAAAPWAQKFAAQTGRVHQHVVRLTREAKAAHDVPATLDPDLFAVAYLSFFYFGLIAWVQGAHPAPEGMVHRLVEQHLANAPATVRPRPPTSRRRKP